MLWSRPLLQLATVALCKFPKFSNSNPNHLPHSPPLLSHFPSLKHTLLKIINLFYFWLHWVFVAAGGLFSSCGERGLLFIVVHRLLIAVASLVAEHRL